MRTFLARLVGQAADLYCTLDRKSSRLGFSDKFLILAGALLVPPLLYLALLGPWIDDSLRKARGAVVAQRTRCERLAADALAADAAEAETRKNAGEIAAVDRLVLTSDAAMQLINELTTLADKAGLDIRFLKKNAQFDRIRDRRFSPPATDGAPPDPTRAFTWRVLPIEIVFNAKTPDTLAFLHILEGFRRLNAGIRKLSITSDGAQLTVTLGIELIVDVKYPTSEKG